MVSHCVDVQYFTYEIHYWLTFGLFLAVALKKTVAVNVLEHVSRSRISKGIEYFKFWKTLLNCLLRGLNKFYIPTDSEMLLSKLK